MTKGFTLVELIAVILVVSVIAAVAVPRFVDLSDAARQVAVNELAGDLLSASTSNLSTFVVREAYSGTIDFSAFPVRSCSDAERLLVTGLPDGYRVEASDPGGDSVSHLGSVRCDIVDESNTSIRADFMLYGIDP